MAARAVAEQLPGTKASVGAQVGGAWPERASPAAAWSLSSMASCLSVRLWCPWREVPPGWVGLAWRWHRYKVSCWFKSGVSKRFDKSPHGKCSGFEGHMVSVTALLWLPESSHRPMQMTVFQQILFLKTGGRLDSACGL